jgi:hypothetical protein
MHLLHDPLLDAHTWMSKSSWFHKVLPCLHFIPSCVVCVWALITNTSILIMLLSTHTHKIAAAFNGCSQYLVIAIIPIYSFIPFSAYIIIAPLICQFPTPLALSWHWWQSNLPSLTQLISSIPYEVSSKSCFMLLELLMSMTVHHSWSCIMLLNTLYLRSKLWWVGMSR